MKRDIIWPLLLPEIKLCLQEALKAAATVWHLRLLISTTLRIIAGPQLSEARAGLVAISTGSKIVFAGGYSYPNNQIAWSNVIDIYDTQTNKWSTAQLNEDKSSFSGAGISNKVILAGGLDAGGSFSKSVEILTFPN